MGDASLPVCRPGLRPAGREPGDAGGRGAVCLSIHAGSSLSQVRVTPVSGCGDSTRRLTDPLPGCSAPTPVSTSPGNSEDGPPGPPRPSAAAPWSLSSRGAPRGGDSGSGLTEPGVAEASRAPSTSRAAGSVPSGQVSAVPVSSIPGAPREAALLAFRAAVRVCAPGEYQNATFFPQDCFPVKDTRPFQRSLCGMGAGSGERTRCPKDLQLRKGIGFQTDYFSREK